MKVTLRITDKVNPETARRLIALVKSRSRQGVSFSLDLNVSEQVAEGLLTDSAEPEKASAQEVPLICRVIRLLKSEDEQQIKVAIASLEAMVGIEQEQEQEQEQEAA